MDLHDKINKTNILDSFPQPKFFLTQLHTIQSKIEPILDDFNKYYVFYNMNPQISENERMFENIKENIQELYTGLKKISDDVDKNVIIINTDYLKLNKLIEILKKRNAILKKKLGIVENTYDGSDTMIDNYKDIYNLQYLKNFSLGLGIIFSLVLISKLFKGQNQNSNPTIS